jgi:hypothetical protein
MEARIGIGQVDCEATARLLAALSENNRRSIVRSGVGRRASSQVRHRSLTCAVVSVRCASHVDDRLQIAACVVFANVERTGGLAIGVLVAFATLAAALDRPATGTLESADTIAGTSRTPGRGSRARFAGKRGVGLAYAASAGIQTHRARSSLAFATAIPVAHANKRTRLARHPASARAGLGGVATSAALVIAQALGAAVVEALERALLPGRPHQAIGAAFLDRVARTAEHPRGADLHGRGRSRWRGRG